MEIHSNYILKHRPTNSIVKFYSQQQRNKTENVLLHLCLSTHLKRKAHLYVTMQSNSDKQTYIKYILQTLQVRTNIKIITLN